MNTPLSERYSQLFAHYPLHQLMRNVQAKSQSFTIDGVTFPVTIVDSVQPNCFTTSTHSALVDYGRDETVKLPKWQQWLINPLLKLASGYLRWAEIDKAQFLNNYALSTNTLSDAFQSLEPNALVQEATRYYPKHAIIIRSLNRQHHSAFIERLFQQGWLLITTRQVYLYEDCQKLLVQRSDNRRDQRLLQDGHFQFRPALSKHDFIAAERWYNSLYLEKYSQQNVQFSAFGLQQLCETGILKLFVLENVNTREIVATAGLVIEDNHTATAPLVGYNIALPQKLGLYRRVIAFVLRYCAEHQLRLNLSSGAPDFKKRRGATPEIEYMAVNIQHLPAKQAKAWRLLAKVSPLYATLLQKYQL